MCKINYYIRAATKIIIKRLLEIRYHTVPSNGRVHDIYLRVSYLATKIVPIKS